MIGFYLDFVKRKFKIEINFFFFWKINRLYLGFVFDKYLNSKMLYDDINL